MYFHLNQSCHDLTQSSETCVHKGFMNQYIVLFKQIS